jgi:hypothetical protein
MFTPDRQDTRTRRHALPGSDGPRFRAFGVRQLVLNLTRILDSPRTDRYAACALKGRRKLAGGERSAAPGHTQAERRGHKGRDPEAARVR